MRLLYGMTSGVSAPGFIQGQPAFMRGRGWDCHLVCSPEGDVAAFAEREGLTFHPVALERNPSPLADARGAWALLRTIRRVRPHVALWGSPKASLLGVLACRMLRVPAIYEIHGLRLEGSRGLARRILWAAEWLTCRMATLVVVDGHELRDLALRLRLVGERKAGVLADGSANGVSADAAQPRYRAELGLPDDAVLVTFAGRITVDKGIRELTAAWPQVAEAVPSAHLLVAGRADAADPLAGELVAALEALPRTHLLGHIDDLDRLWADSDLAVLPSYREGLPLVTLEAAAQGVPSVVSDATGCSEAVGEGGVVVPRRDATALAAAIIDLARDGERRRELGTISAARAQGRYGRERVWSALDRLLRVVAGRGHR